VVADEAMGQAFKWGLPLELKLISKQIKCLTLDLKLGIGPRLFPVQRRLPIAESAASEGQKSSCVLICPLQEASWEVWFLREKTKKVHIF
jgi:hypothetical protein